jgi:hypothetical protein
MKKVIIYFWFNFIYLASKAFECRYLNNHNNKINETQLAFSYCKDPSIEQLDNLLVENYKHVLKNIKEGIDIYPFVQEKHKNLILDASKNVFITNQTHGDTACSKIQTTWHQYEVSTCPHHYVDVLRQDRYPYQIKHAICNCVKCLGIKSLFSRCVPINVAKPVLLKNSCRANGIFEWRFAMELIPIGCNCVYMLDVF